MVYDAVHSSTFVATFHRSTLLPHVASFFANKSTRRYMPSEYNPHQYRCENLKDLRLHIFHRFLISGKKLLAKSVEIINIYCTGCVGATNLIHSANNLTSTCLSVLMDI